MTPSHPTSAALATAPARIFATHRTKILERRFASLAT
jgi:hypothetical protein